tara:strand:- start:593 stop:955 length:363 start_codon:yes stop_codon:yes gene_type:complete
MAILTANNPLIIEIKNIQGKEIFCPGNSVAQIFADIAREDTLSLETLQLIQGLGYKIEIMTEDNLDWEFEHREEAYCEIDLDWEFEHRRLEEARLDAMYDLSQYNSEFLGAQPARAGEDY